MRIVLRAQRGGPGLFNHQWFYRHSVLWKAVFPWMGKHYLWLISQSTTGMGQIQTVVGNTTLASLKLPSGYTKINSLKVLWKFTIKSSKYRAKCQQSFRPNCAAMISLWNTFNHTFWVFNITKLSDWCKQACLIQTNSSLSLCERSMLLD